MTIRQVEIDVTSTVVGQYNARAYPHDGADHAGFVDLYQVPVYRIFVNGKDDSGGSQQIIFMAPRFMPYFNDPKKPSTKYSARGWLNSGLSAARRVVVPRYIADYQVRNMYSPGLGAIVVKDAFYIHAGPAALSDEGFGSAGCIEIIGNYDDFKQAINDLSGLVAVDSDTAITTLVNNKKLIVDIKAERAPDIKSKKVSRVKLF